MNKKVAITLILVCGVLVVAAAFAGGSTASSPAEPSKTIRALQIEKRDTLRQKEKIVQAKHKTGNATFEDLGVASNQLLDAELDLATTKVERIAICEKKLKNVRDYEEYAEKKHRAGYAVSTSAMLDARVARLDAEIQLAKEKNSEK